MFPRNLIVFRFATLECEDIETALAAHPARDPGEQEFGARGFASPYGRQDDRMCVRAPGSPRIFGFVYQERSRDLRLSAVNDEVAKRVEKIAEDEGRKVGGRERKEIAENVWNELLPRALITTRNITGWIDLVNGRVVIGARTRKKAEDALSALREAFGSLNATPTAPEESPRILMTHWLATGELPEGIVLGDECELRDPSTASGSIARCRRQDLDSDEIREHLRSGKQCFSTGLVFDDRLSLVLGEDLTVTALRPTDVVLDAVDARYESQAEEVEGTFALAVLEVNRLVDFLETTFRIERPEAT